MALTHHTQSLASALQDYLHHSPTYFTDKYAVANIRSFWADMLREMGAEKFLAGVEISLVRGVLYLHCADATLRHALSYERVAIQARINEKLAQSLVQKVVVVADGGKQRK